MVDSGLDDSRVLLDESYSTQADDFLSRLGDARRPKALAGFAARWAVDGRPWARARLIEYLDSILDRPGHQALVKTLLRTAESQGDSVLMGALMVAFDRLVRRFWTKRVRFDAKDRVLVVEEVLSTQNNAMPGLNSHRTPRGSASRPAKVFQVRRKGRLFTHHTRYYLRRRAVRWFRTLARKSPSTLVRSVADAVARYTDADLDRGESILDSWALLNLLYRHHPALTFTASHVRLALGHRLADLEPAPRWPELWRQPAAMAPLVDLVVGARSSLVRKWAMAWLSKEHSGRLAVLPSADLIRLAQHPDPAVQDLAARLFAQARDLGTLTLSTWLTLLSIHHSALLEELCGAFRRHVTPARVDLDTLLTLAIRPAAPVVRLALDLLRGHPFGTGQSARLTALSQAECEALAPELIPWALDRLSRDGIATVDTLLEFLDAPRVWVRRGALGWAFGPATDASPRAGDSTLLLTRLMESPHDDVRRTLVDHLEKCQSNAPVQGRLDRVVPTTLPTQERLGLYAAVLLGMHSGGRQKARALTQVARWLREASAPSEDLVALAVVGLRSLEAGQRHSALAALVDAVTRRPELVPTLSRLAPELQFMGEVLTP